MNGSVPALEIRNLTKSFDDRPAVDDLDLTVFAGEFYTLLGPNGAGKTTTLRIVAGLLRPDAGSGSASTPMTAARGFPRHAPEGRLRRRPDP